MDCGSLSSHCVRLIAHRMYTAGIDPPIVKIEQCANGDCIVNRFVGIAGLMQYLDIRRFNGHRIAIHFVNEAEQRFLVLRQR